MAKVVFFHKNGESVFGELQKWRHFIFYQLINYAISEVSEFFSQK
jgi:hypothetical protein